MNIILSSKNSKSSCKYKSSTKSSCKSKSKSIRPSLKIMQYNRTAFKKTFQSFIWTTLSKLGWTQTKVSGLNFIKYDYFPPGITKSCGCVNKTYFNTITNVIDYISTSDVWRHRNEIIDCLNAFRLESMKWKILPNNNKVKRMHMYMDMYMYMDMDMDMPMRMQMLTQTQTQIQTRMQRNREVDPIHSWIQMFLDSSSSMKDSKDCDEIMTPYTDALQEIMTFKKKDVLSFVSYCVNHIPHSPQEQAQARFRMRWATKQIQRYYLKRIYGEEGNDIPQTIQSMMTTIFEQTKNSKEDERLWEQNYLLGQCVRTLDENELYITGIVEEVYLYDDGFIAYNIYFPTKSKFEIWKEEDVESQAFPASFGDFELLVVT